MSAPLTRADMAEAFESFWNAAIGACHARQDGAATIGPMAEGFAAIANRLRELDAEPAPAPAPPPPWNGRTHDLKTWPDVFAAMAAWLKPWDLRINDRGFAVGDKLRLKCWSPADQDETGEVLERLVIWMLEGPAFGLPEGYVIMSLAEMPGEGGQS